MLAEKGWKASSVGSYQQWEKNLVDNLPSKSELASAGLNIISHTEQPLSLQ
jgi:hypothetical protein